MCITIGPADLENTILLAHSIEQEGGPINVVGYQNVAKNRDRGPNAMVLPFPAMRSLSKENCLDASKHPQLLKNYASLVVPRTRGGSRSFSKGASIQVEVFDSGSYTVVLASDATAIPSAIDRVRPNKRPRLHPELFDAYHHWYPGWSVALCCWDGTIEAEPLLWWYEPMSKYRTSHFLPGLDGHDGAVPDPARISVTVDHTIVIGSTPADSSGKAASHVLEGIQPDLARFLPKQVYGTRIRRQMRNGDWVLPKEGWDLYNAEDRLLAPREMPPGFGLGLE